MAVRPRWFKIDKVKCLVFLRHNLLAWVVGSRKKIVYDVISLARLSPKSSLVNHTADLALHRSDWLLPSCEFSREVATNQRCYTYIYIYIVTSSVLRTFGTFRRPSHGRKFERASTHSKTVKLSTSLNLTYLYMAFKYCAK